MKNIVNHTIIGLIKEPLDVDFVVNRTSLHPTRKGSN